MSRNGKVIVAMSGGVDSSVAAALLKEQGYECVGVFMRVGAAMQEEGTEEGTEAPRHEGTKGRDQGIEGSGDREEGTTEPRRHEGSEGRVPHPFKGGGRTSTEELGTQTRRRLKHGCCSAADALDARAIAGRLGIPFYALNFERDFDGIIDYFVDEYAAGRTPNPCVMCNIHLKFGKLLRYADLMDAEFVATGHYARILRRGGRSLLARSRNAAKDQSYVLYGIRREDLSRCLFPLGEIEDKAQVRRIAADLGLRVHDKPDSQEICFVPNNDYRQLVHARRPETKRTGEVRDTEGHLLGSHDGVASFTIGQRRGLGIAAGKPIYVTHLDVLANRVTVGPRERLLSGGLIADKINWLSDPPREPVPVEIKIRHMHAPAPGTLRAHWGEQRSASPTEVEATFEQPQPAVTPGQAAVFYADGTVLGGGWIREALAIGEWRMANSE